MRIWPVGLTREDRSVVILIVEVAAVIMRVVGEGVAFMWGRLIRLLIIRIMMVVWVERIILLVISILQWMALVIVLVVSK
jgi:hypothetical protein